MEYIIIENKIGTKINIENINYIDIQNRKPCYHLTNNELIYGKSIQKNFLKTIYPLNEKPYMFFVAKGILCNLNNIKSIDKKNNKIIFYNNDWVKAPSLRIKEIYNTWLSYT